MKQDRRKSTQMLLWQFLDFHIYLNWKVCQHLLRITSKKLQEERAKKTCIKNHWANNVSLKIAEG